MKKIANVCPYCGAGGKLNLVVDRPPIIRANAAVGVAKIRQNIQIHPEYTSAFYDSALSEYFHHAGARFAEESAIFSTAVRCVLAADGQLSNKAIILWLIQTLDETDDEAHADAIRNTLEIVVGYTMDDL